MISVELDHNSSKTLYSQLSEYIREEISEGRLAAGEKLPSLRSMARMLDISVTTVKIAYVQLQIEGYLDSKPNSGFYVAAGAGNANNDAASAQKETESGGHAVNGETAAGSFKYDPESFDFIKWRKCGASVLSDTPELLFTEADRQGEPALRKEIAEYLYKSRGVICEADQVIVSAGTQQLVNHIARILRMMDIENVCTEDPGYLPVRNIFRDWGFSISRIPVKQDGIEIEKLPVNIRTAAYVCPQNQFPTGAVMPISRRHQILKWAAANDSIVIEDDYNSELRYFGKPVPALQGLDSGGRVVYIGSFTSTLFPAVRISYMVLPKPMKELYRQIMMNYDQTCSKTEQLTLALFMQRGYYQTNLRKVRNLYSRKLQETVSAIRDCDPSGKFISAKNSQSGINIILKINTRVRTITEGTTGKDRTEEIRRELVQRLISSAAKLGLKVRGIDQLDREGQIYLIFYYNQIPLSQIRGDVSEMIADFRSAVMKGSSGMPSVYEVIRIRDGKPVFLQEHYDRLGRSLAALGIMPPFSFDILRGCIDDMVRDGGIENHNLKLEVDISGHSVIYMSPTHYPDAALYESGVRTELFSGERKNPNIKMMDQELRDAADAAIKRSGAFEVLLVDRKGNITEGSRSNVFFIKDNKVVTPPTEQVLPGVTRSKVIDVAGALGLELHQIPVAAESAGDYDAAFISGTSLEVLPVSEIGDLHFDVHNKVLREILSGYSACCGQ